MSYTHQCKRQWTHSIRLNSRLSISLLVYLIFKRYYCGCNVVLMNNTVWTRAVGFTSWKRRVFTEQDQLGDYHILNGSVSSFGRDQWCMLWGVFLVSRTPHAPSPRPRKDRVTGKTSPQSDTDTVACKTRSVIEAGRCLTCVEHCFVVKKVICIYF